ncbi:protein xmas [Periplaneta americana]|uniref:protein xmas n=1 Tax=Periplaneta americana TaxID=6978 RepID=UPI0037E870EB
MQTRSHASGGRRASTSRSGRVVKKTDSPEKLRTSLSQSTIQQLKNLYCSNIPDHLMDRDLLKNHFSQFGRVTRVYVNMKKNTCTVHFDSHESAARAKFKGADMEDSTLTIFWSKPAKITPAMKEIEISSANKEQESQDDRGKSKEKQVYSKKERLPEAADSKNLKEDIKMFAYSSTGRKYAVPEEVQDELEVMSCIEESSKLNDSKIAPKASSSRDFPGPSHRVKTKKTDAPTVRIAPARLQLPELLKLWETKSKHPAVTAEERYQLLDLRDKILRLKLGKQSDLSQAKATEGTCEDMCPEKERYQRESRHQVALYEYQAGASKEVMMDHALAVKQYSRSSAAQEEPLPHDLRPPHVLRMTMDYLLLQIINRCENKDENLGDWYHFLWDRTRGIRKDITQQELCDIEVVALVEQCARFHIHCSERLIAEDISVFDSKINSENLTKCLQTLKYMYHDMSLKGITCPNEAEFRGYIILLNLSDANFMWELKELNSTIINSEPVKFAVEVFLALSSNNYIRFFKLVKRTSYLNACILLRYFYQVRLKALSIILKSHRTGSKKLTLSLEELMKWVVFESIREAALFCDHYGLELNDENTEVTIYRDAPAPFISSDLPASRAISLIESKRQCSVGEAIKGGPLTRETFQNYRPHSSFDSEGLIDQKAVEVTSALEIVPKTQDKHEWYYGNEEQKVEKPKQQRESTTHVCKSYEEQALEEAERQQHEEIMQSMVSEIVKDELQVFCDRLSNVAILEEDEMLLEVCCLMSRDVFKEVFTEEEQKKKAEEESKAAAERERQIDAASNESVEDIVASCTEELIREICEKEERSHNASIEEMEDLLENVIQTECKNITQMDLREERYKLLEKKVTTSCVKRQFDMWKKNVKYIVEQRKILYNIPAGMSTSFLDGKVEKLPCRTVKICDEPLASKDCMDQIPIFDILGTGLFINTEKKFGTYQFFKVVVSLPDEKESPVYGSFIREYTQKVFSINKDPSAINQPVPLTLGRLTITTGHQITASVRRVVGQNMVEGRMKNPDALTGVSGLVFVVCHDHVSFDLTKQRLHALLKAKHHYGGVPVAFVVTDSEDLSHLEADLGVDELTNETGIRTTELFHRVPKCSTGLHDTFCKALLWLHQNSEDPAIYCTTAESLLYENVSEYLWERFEFYEASEDEVTRIKMDFKSVLHIHNKACEELLSLVTDETVNKCGIGAPEFNNFVPPLADYTVMPSYFGSAEYKEALCKLFKSAEFNIIGSISANTTEELFMTFKSICIFNDIPEEEMDRLWTYITDCLDKANCSDTEPEWSISIRLNVPWIKVLKMLFLCKWRRLDFRDHISGDKNKKLMVAVRNEKISTFLEKQWLNFLREKEELCPSIAPEVLENLQTRSLSVKDMAKREIPQERGNSVKHSGNYVSDEVLEDLLNRSLSWKDMTKRKMPEEMGNGGKRSRNYGPDKAKRWSTALNELSKLIDRCYNQQKELEDKLSDVLSTN